MFQIFLWVDHTLFRYNVLFENDINTPNEPSGEKNGIAYLGGYSPYVNPLWCDNIPPKDGNIFLKNGSTLKGKECVVLLENPRAKVSLTPWVMFLDMYPYLTHLCLNCKNSNLWMPSCVVF